MLFNNLEAQASHIIKKYEKENAALTDNQLQERAESLKKLAGEQGCCTKFTGGQEALKELLFPAFALVREAAYRELGYRHHKEQLMAGLALHESNLTQMHTGEGKTLAIVAPAYLAALTGQKVHVVTANDYLARRDGEAMGGIYARLGVSCAVISSQIQQQFVFDFDTLATPVLERLRPCTRKEAYRAEIIYGTASAFGFDYLRDHLVYRPEDLTGSDPEKTFAILDEADNILLDEARTPLVISRPSHLDIAHYYRAIELVGRLIAAQDYEVDKTGQKVSFTERGIVKLERWLYSTLSASASVARSLYSGNSSELFYLENCLKALTLYQRDEDYLVSYDPPSIGATLEHQTTYPTEDRSDNHNLWESSPGTKGRAGEVVLIDRQTGRPLKGRRLGSGLHEALEAKEGLTVKSPATTIATISLQAYFKLYRKLAGLSGTVQTDRDILYRLYGLQTVVIPSHRPLQRIEAPALVFRTRQQALHSLVDTALKVRQSGAPVLIGTPSVGVSEEVSGCMRQLGVPHQVLNARQTLAEARTIARAGYPGRITVATNMAGRGTDIVLGGQYEDHRDDLAQERGLVLKADGGTSEWRKLETDAHARHRRARGIVYGAGGLHVLGLGLQSSRRLDLQLAGRAGRQGDPGYAQFLYSLEDELVRRYAGESRTYQRLLGATGATVKDVEFPFKEGSSLALKLVQECQNQAEGQQLDALTQAIEYDSVLGRQREIFYRERQAIVLTSASELKTEVLRIVAPTSSKTSLYDLSQKIEKHLELDVLSDRTVAVNTLRQKVLCTFDRAWIEYLTALGELRQGITLRAYGGQNPLQAFQKEAFDLWNSFRQTLRSKVEAHLFSKVRHYQV